MKLNSNEQIIYCKNEIAQAFAAWREPIITSHKILYTTHSKTSYTNSPSNKIEKTLKVKILYGHEKISVYFMWLCDKWQQSPFWMNERTVCERENL